MLPLDVAATIKTPPLQGQPDCPFPISFVAQYEHLVKNRFTFVGSGSKTVDFGSIPGGAKALMVTVDRDSSPATAPVTLAMNGSTDVLEVSPGGFLLFGSPAPTAQGITGMTIAYTSSVKMYVWIFG